MHREMIFIRSVAGIAPKCRVLFFTLSNLRLSVQLFVLTASELFARFCRVEKLCVIDMGNYPVSNTVYYHANSPSVHNLQSCLL